MAVKVMVRTIVECVSEITRIPVEEFYADNRRRHVSSARFAVFAVSTEYGHSLKDIGRQLGNRDHTSVMHGVRQSKVYEIERPGFRLLITALRKYVAKIADSAAVKVTPVSRDMVDSMMRDEPAVDERTQKEKFTYRGMVRGSERLAQALISQGGYKEVVR